MPRKSRGFGGPPPNSASDAESKTSNFLIRLLTPTKTIAHPQPFSPAKPVEKGASALCRHQCLGERPSEGEVG
jgi:hypothetical protein